MPGTSPSVLIIRLDGIGDALALAPLLAAFEECAIPVDLVLRDVNAAIFSARAARRVFVAGFDLRSSKRANLRNIEAFARTLPVGAYTHVLVATEDPAGYRLARAVDASVRVGFANGWGKAFKTLWARTLLTQTVYRPAGLDPSAPHECDVVFRLGAPLLGDTAPTRDAARLRPLVVDESPAPDSRIAVQITDKWARLGIAFEDVVELVRLIGESAPLRLIASAREPAYAGAIANALPHPVERFDRLEPWKTAIAAARAAVVPDCGALHVAGMVGTPTVAVFPAGRDAALQTARWAPWASRYRIERAEAGWPARAAAALDALLGA